MIIQDFSFEQDDDNDQKESIVNKYIKLICNNNAKPIFSTNHFSQLVGFSEQFLFAVSASPYLFYRKYKIKKKSSGYRTINEPLPTLKLIQTYIINQVLRDVKPNKVAKAYRKNHTLRGNAIIHYNRPFMLKIDIENFFSNIKEHEIYNLFFNLGYTKQVAVLLCKLCTLNNGLPQGAPSSPLLSNLVMAKFDELVFNHCIQNNIYYTRYADDMFFSSMSDQLEPLIPFIRKHLKKYNLTINDKKTYLAKTGARKYVTGIVVNEKLNILKTYRKKLRQEMYFIKKFGINGHLRMIKNTEAHYIDRLIGRLNFAFFVTKEEHFKNDIKYLCELKKILD